MQLDVCFSEEQLASGLVLVRGKASSNHPNPKSDQPVMLDSRKEQQGKN
jgi:hypothetical protein